MGWEGGRHKSCRKSDLALALALALDLDLDRDLALALALGGWGLEGGRENTQTERQAGEQEGGAPPGGSTCGQGVVQLGLS